MSRPAHCHGCCCRARPPVSVKVPTFSVTSPPSPDAWEKDLGADDRIIHVQTARRQPQIPRLSGSQPIRRDERPIRYDGIGPDPRVQTHTCPIYQSAVIRKHPGAVDQPAAAAEEHSATPIAARIEERPLQK